MGSYATVYLGDGRPICHFGNGVDPLFYRLFTRNDWIHLTGVEAYEVARRSYTEVEPNDAELVGFAIKAGALRDRLDVMGVSMNVIRARLDELIKEESGRDVPRSTSLPADIVREWRSEIERWTSLDSHSWLQQLETRLREGDEVQHRSPKGAPGTASWLMSVWEDNDPRYQLRAVLDAVDADEPIYFDLADLIDGGWLDPTIDPRDVAHDFVVYATHGGLTPLVLTEGRFDSEVLTAALRVRRPHLADFIRFPDFNARPEGGAAALRQTVRAFASAGIPNRVVALFDNDTAARDVLRGLPRDNLPHNIVVTQLPHLALAEHYPTRGPQGLHDMDVNGLAVSIEMFLGADVLRDGDCFRPVEWRGYISSISAYQGEISAKGTVQDMFRKKLAAIEGDLASREYHDWSAIDLLIDHIIAAIDDASTGA